MVFGLFHRKSGDASPARLPTPTPSIDPHSPVSNDLHDLMVTIPPKTLHTYTLDRLCPPPSTSSRPPSPDTVTKLTAFFSTLAPPPLRHCVRCHKDFYEIENEDKDKACRVAHDDESTLVSRISGGGYETLWGCCGQTAPGDGSEGPPDGWCYEGRHTTDTKRARFRADSTMHDDKLASCLKHNCHGIRDRLPRPHTSSPSRTIAPSSTRKSNASPARSHASVLITRAVRKRPHQSFKESSSENEADGESVAGKAKGGDDPNSPPKSRVKKSQPIVRVRPPASTSTTASVSTKPRTATVKSTSRTLLSQSHTYPASDSEGSTRSRPRTRSHVREESRGRTTSKLTRADLARRTKKATSEEESDQSEVERGRKKRRVSMR